MPPTLALALTLLFMGYVLRRDFKEEPRVSSAVWIPIIWLMINGSRQVSQWIGSGAGGGFSVQRLEDGSPIDKAVYGILIFAGICVLAKRRVRIGDIVKKNFPLVLFLLYEGLSVIWSDFPDVAFKRWSKGLGDPVMLLVLWSEPFPASAITATIKRCAYVLITLSVLFCKYYENLGRSFDAWGHGGYGGVTTDKNMLGYLLFTFGLFFAAAFISRPDRNGDERKRERSTQIINIAMLVMIGWLHLIANSKTALLAMVVGIGVVVALRVDVVRRHFAFWATAVVLLGTVLQASFSLSDLIFESAGRDATFTGRTGLWQTLLQETMNPLIGVGYGSFWLGERVLRYWKMFPTSPPIEAHNGYLEVYINLGLIGLCLLAGVLWDGLTNMRRRLTSAAFTDNESVLRTFGIAYGLAYLFYNVTEATFQGMNFLFVIFLILAFGEPAEVWRTQSAGLTRTGPKVLPTPISHLYLDRAERPPRKTVRARIPYRSVGAHRSANHDPLGNGRA